jgi:hypothetical protein
MGNDPRPHYMHQSNLADWTPALPETDPNQGGILYPMIDGLLGRYETYFDRSDSPLVQLTSKQIVATLQQQATWAANVASGKVAAWLEDGQLHVRNLSGAPMDVALTGTTVGDMYGGQKSGWTTIAAGAEQAFTPNDPVSASAPTVSGTARAGSTLTATHGAWSGTPGIDYGYQWQRCTSGGRCTNIAGATGASYTVTSADGGFKLRVVVTGGNWISSVSQARSALPRTTVPKSAASKRKAARISLTKVKMSPRKFPVSHKKKRRGTRLDGTRITWRLNKRAKMQISIQHLTGHKNHRRWVRVRMIKRNGKVGTNVLLFRGYRTHRTLLNPRHYRLVAVAIDKRVKSRHKHITFRVVRG